MFESWLRSVIRRGQVAVRDQQKKVRFIPFAQPTLICADVAAVWGQLKKHRLRKAALLGTATATCFLFTDAWARLLGQVDSSTAYRDALVGRLLDTRDERLQVANPSIRICGCRSLLAPSTRRAATARARRIANVVAGIASRAADAWKLWEENGDWNAAMQAVCGNGNGVPADGYTAKFIPVLMRLAGVMVPMECPHIAQSGRKGLMILTGCAVTKNNAMVVLQMFAEELNERWSSPPALPNYNILDLESQICAWAVAGCPRECTGHHAAMEGALQLQHR